MSDTNGYCPSCGASWGRLARWPRTCKTCERITYRNPIPVVVVLLPVLDRGGLLLVRRAIEPGKGKLALPGGYIDVNDATWQTAAAREMREETGLRLSHKIFREYLLRSTPDGLLILFTLATKGIHWADLKPGPFDGEVSEFRVLTRPAELAFPTHTEVVSIYFAQTRAESQRPSPV